MSKMKVAVYDTDELYRKRFADYLMSYKVQEMDLAVFSSLDYFFDALNVDKYQLLVLGCGYEEVLPRVRVMQIPVLVLSEQLQCYVRESTGIEDAQVSYTSKYQSMEVITHQMYLMTEARKNYTDVLMNGPELEVLGVLSPIHHEMQMFFSMLYAQNRNADRKVLYLNLMDFSGFEVFFEERENDLEDFILQLREPIISSEAVRSCIYESERFSYVYPFRNPANASAFTGKDLEQLLKFLMEYTDYRVVVIDFGGITEDFAELLKRCQCIYCLSKSGQFYEMQVERFMEYVKSNISDIFAERIKRIELPYQPKGIGRGLNFLEQLSWSEFGDFIRRLL